MLIVPLFCVFITSMLLFWLCSVRFSQEQLNNLLPVYMGIVLFIVLSCQWAAGSLTKSIIKPINKVVFDKDSFAFDELSPFIRRIQDQKKQLSGQLDEILKEKTLLDALLKSMNEGLILVDRGGGMLSVNQSAYGILGIDESYIGRNILEAIRNIEIFEHLTLAVSGQNSEFIFDISSRTYQILFSPVDNGALILFLDITEKAKSEKLRREFSANVSHELKTPLTIISGYAELIENGMVKKEDITRMAAKIKKESARLVILIEDIIRLSQLDESDWAKNFTELDLAEVAVEAADSLKQRAADAKVSIELPSCKATVEANREMMFEMFYNLIDNGIKYNKPGGKIKISLSQTQGKTNILVSDTGIGIEKKHLDRIFERFYRVDTSRSKKTGGTGLGLSIVKHIAVFHNGVISVESNPGAGTTIRVTI